MEVVRRKFALGAALLASASGCESLAESPALSRPAFASPAVTGPSPVVPPSGRPVLPDTTPPPEPADAALPINLATALQLAHASPLDVQIAGRQVEAAAARYDRARLWWAPNIVAGTDYFVHTGPQQNFEAALPRSDRSTFMAGFGPNVVFGFSDAVYAPLAARQELRARRADRQASANDAARDVAEAYFNVQQARGELAAAQAALRHAEEVARKTEALAKGLAPAAEAHRANTELGRRKQAVTAARERWRTAGAELARLLRLDPTAVVEPVEPPSLPVTLIDPAMTLDGLIPVALSTRPELAGNQALVQATLARLKQEKLRPLVPSLVIRGASTNPGGTLAYGAFGGGRNGTLRDFGGRFDIDVQLLWEFQALGFGNQARVNERRAEYEAATLELFRRQDRVAAEVATAFAQVRAAAERANAAEPALAEASELVKKIVEGLGQSRRIGESLILVVRPQEAVAAVQAFAQASSDYFGAVADYNRAQFRLYRALGHPAECLAHAVPTPEPPAAIPPVPDEKPAQLPPLPVVSPSEVEQAGAIVPSGSPGQPTPLAAEPEWGPARGTAVPPRKPVVVPEREQ